ncbi:MAG: FkbM family methyltransferase [Burkholderiales bacterium]
MLKRLQSLPALVGMMGTGQTLKLAAGWLLARKTIQIRVNDVSTPITIRRDDSDIYVFRDALLKRDSDPTLDEQPRFIIDGGANVGYTTALYASKYPNAVIVAVEPAAQTAKILRRHCRPYPNVHVVEAGLWSHPCTLGVHGSDGNSFALQVREVPPGTPGAVRAVTIPGLMRDFGMDSVGLLKLDIEGAELQVFSAPDLGWIDRVRVLAIELHGPRAERAVESAMEIRGFSKQRSGEKIVFRNTSKDLFASGFGIAQRLS